MRADAEEEDVSPLLVVAGMDVDDVRSEPHTHPAHLLLWSATSTIAVRTDGRDWVVAPRQGLWVPAGTRHSYAVLRHGETFAVFFGVDRRTVDWCEPTGIRVGSLMRELIIHLERNPTPSEARSRAEAVIIDLLEPIASTTIDVPIPMDERLRAVAEQLLADPANDRDLAAWAHEVGAGVRTLTRLFVAETGMTFGQWRTRIRIRAAIDLLARGVPVATAAKAVGYRKAGAFADAFQRVTGQSPRAIAASLERETA